MSTDTERLRAAVEQKMGKPLLTPGDFDELSLRIKMQTGEDLSLSTIKRLWGYTRPCASPRFRTLSVLSRFLGFRDWDDWLAQGKRA